MQRVPGVPAIRLKETHEEALAAASSASARAAPAANQVVVYPGAATFSSIAAALASITDAGPAKPYDVLVGPGTYKERLTLKEYVYLEGAGRDKTTVTSPPTDTQGSAVIVAASQSGISGMTVSCLGGTWGDWGTAFMCQNVNPFNINECDLIADDQNNAGINLTTMQIDLNASGGSLLEIVDSGIQATAQNAQSVPVAMQCWNNARVAVQPGSKVVAKGGLDSFGVTLPYYGKVDLYYAYIEAATWAIYRPGGMGQALADHCQIVGPVSSGVKVIGSETRAPGS